MPNNVVEILQSVVGELKEMARSQSIVAAPITVGDKTVVPVVRMTVGFGAGGGQGEADKKGSGFGGGGGGGVSIEPAAFIIMDKDGISLLPAKKGNWESLIEAIPGVASKIMELKGKHKPDKGTAAEEATS
ncbi:MAG: spore germination protein GerW family protein [Candidatus Zixiibacteriota bacterium]